MLHHRSVLQDDDSLVHGELSLRYASCSGRITLKVSFGELTCSHVNAVSIHFCGSAEE